jgi:methyl-accepting chemotaxis protein
VAEMDKVVQQNAANAEESASASEEMTAQAEQMKGMVNELTTLVGGSGRKMDSRRQAAASEMKAADARAITSPGRRTKERELVLHKGNPAAQRANMVKPEQVIPMKDEDFKDF